MWPSSCHPGRLFEGRLTTRLRRTRNFGLGGWGVKLENLWNKKKAQINSVGWQLVIFVLTWSKLLVLYGYDAIKQNGQSVNLAAPANHSTIHRHGFTEYRAAIRVLPSDWHWYAWRNNARNGGRKMCARLHCRHMTRNTPNSVIRFRNASRWIVTGDPHISIIAWFPLPRMNMFCCYTPCHQSTSDERAMILLTAKGGTVAWTSDGSCLSRYCGQGWIQRPQ